MQTNKEKEETSAHLAAAELENDKTLVVGRQDSKAGAGERRRGSQGAKL